MSQTTESITTIEQAIAYVYDAIVLMKISGEPARFIDKTTDQDILVYDNGDSVAITVTATPPSSSITVDDSLSTETVKYMKSMINRIDFRKISNVVGSIEFSTRRTDTDTYSRTVTVALSGYNTLPRVYIVSTCASTTTVKHTRPQSLSRRIVNHIVNNARMYTYYLTAVVGAYYCMRAVNCHIDEMDSQTRAMYYQNDLSKIHNRLLGYQNADIASTIKNRRF